MNDILRALEALPDAAPQVPRIDFYCIECRTGPHEATEHCACCADCGRALDDCKCGCPPRGVVLSAKWLRTLRADCEGRDKNSGSPFWTERVGALLDHLELLTNPKLPGM